jgi:hypothetical protein
VTSPSPSSNLLNLLSTYEQIRHQIQPGDVIAFSGSDLPSGVVKIAMQSDYVHVAIALSTDTCNADGDTVLIAESHIDTSLPSVGTGERILGAQVQWLSHRLAACESSVWWFALKTPLSEESRSKMQSWLRKIEQERIPYDFVQAVGVGLDALGIEINNETCYSALFCSELVTRALQISGVIDDEINPSEQTPVDVIHFPCFRDAVLIKEPAEK